MATFNQPRTAWGTAVHTNDSCFLVWKLKLAVTTVLEIIHKRNNQTSLLLVEEYVPVFLWTLQLHLIHWRDELNKHLEQPKTKYEVNSQWYLIQFKCVSFISFWFMNAGG
jgi:hypothetical protein